MITENQAKPYELMSAKSENKVRFAFELNEKVVIKTEPYETEIKSLNKEAISN